jgi:hypothetical protein
MPDVNSNLMDSNLLGVCNERDDDRRAAAIARVYTDDAIWTSDEAVTVGHGAPKSTNVCRFGRPEIAVLDLF